MFVYLLLGAAVGALIYGFVPQDFVVRVAGADNPLAIPLAAVIGIPMYIRAETIIPVSSVLISKGIPINETADGEQPSVTGPAFWYNG
ncbi:MAG: permease [Candidatus Desulforudis sp.]|nr:permease [Desulforudis sp.]